MTVSSPEDSERVFLDEVMLEMDEVADSATYYIPILNILENSRER